jgi:hypothetical protein
MANTARLLASLGQLIKARLTHTAKEQKLAGQERRLIQEMGRVLLKIGYRLVSVNVRANTRGGAPAKRSALPRTLKCPKCDRRFSLQMHVARHLSAMHGTKGTGRRKTKPAKS